ncbi:hypothetical protein, partial [Paracraurococcus ruber]
MRHGERKPLEAGSPGKVTAWRRDDLLRNGPPRMPRLAAGIGPGAVRGLQGDRRATSARAPRG